MIEFCVVAAAFLVSGAIFSLWEYLQPRQSVSYQQVIVRDLAALVIVLGLTVLVEVLTHPITTAIKAIVGFDWATCQTDLTPSFWISLAAFYLVWDFTLYWFHWFMHRPVLWPTHRWHHAPATIWWLSGIRASLFHSLLFQIAFFWFWLFRLPYWVYLVLLSEFVVRNGWMHLNVHFRGQRLIEYLVVTPRYHAIHHADIPEYYNQNMGSLLTIWDRLFGTFVDPDKVDFKAMKYGLKDTPHPARMIIGID